MKCDVLPCYAFFPILNKGEAMIAEQFDEFRINNETAIARTIIFSVLKLPTDFSLGINNHINILTGSTASAIIDNKLYEHKTYGSLDYMPKNRIKIYIHKLIDLRMIEILILDQLGRDGKPMGVLNATKRGIDFMHNEDKLDLDLKFISDLNLTDSEWKLFEALRILRKSISKDEGISAWVIINNKRLLNMVKVKPTTKEELLSKASLGPRFIEIYGDKFLNVIKTFLGTDSDDEDISDLGSAVDSSPPGPAIPDSSYSQDLPSQSASDDLNADTIFEEEEEDDVIESIPEMEDRINQESRNLQEFKKNIDPRPIWKQKTGNQGTERWRNKEQNKERISTPHPSACKVCGTPTGKIYSYQCLKCRSPL